MKKAIRQITSWFLLAAFLLAAAPKELIHEIAGHEDTVDLFHTDPQVGALHVHCCALLLSLPSFIGSAELSLPLQLIELAPLHCSIESVCFFSSSICSFGRGPPQVA